MPLIDILIREFNGAGQTFIAVFHQELLNKDFARNLLSWRHSGFSIDNSVRILEESAQENLAEYIARPPISLAKIRYEPFKGRVLFHTTYSEYFKENLHMFDALDFIAVIENPDEITRILRHLVKIGWSPPGFDPDQLN